MQPQPYQVPTTGYDVPPGAPRARALRVPASLAVLGLGLAIAMNAIDTVARPLFVVGARGADRAMIDNLAAIEALLIIVTYLFTAVAFITWTYLARGNIERWAIGGLGWGPGWAIGGWFIPIANLVIPKLVMDAVHSGSEVPPDAHWSERRSSGLVTGWWVTLVVAGIAANAYARLGVEATGTVAGVTAFNAVSTVLYMISGVLAIALVRRVTALQEARQAALDARR